MFELMMATLFPGCRPRSVEAKETDVAVCVRGQEECALSPAADTDRCETPSTDNQSESEQSASEVGRRMRGLGELSKRYACAAARVERCNLFPCDREMGASGAFDTFDTRRCRRVQAGRGGPHRRCRPESVLGTGLGHGVLHSRDEASKGLLRRAFGVVCF